MQNSRFFYRILLPSLVAVVLFLSALYLFVIPNYRESLMDKKRETIRELTNTAWSVMHKLNEMIGDTFPQEQARREAALIISDMRYGEGLKDYFWITDTVPVMVMHPYRPQMNEMPLADYEDQAGKKFFMEIVEIAKTSGDGYIDYKWQWKDDSLIVVPKLSYVKAFEPWGWIVGTGIYVEDVKREIEAITRQVVWISFVITLLIAALIGYLARRNYTVEQEKEKAREHLRETMEKYKKLVEASTDGVLMMMNGEIIYCNPYLLNLLGFTEAEQAQHDAALMERLEGFVNAWTGKGTLAPVETQELVLEHKIARRDGLLIDVVISRSQFDMEGRQGYIYTIKDVSRHKDVERELDLNMEKFRSIAGLLHLGVFRCTLGRRSRFVEINKKALALLGYESILDLKDLHVQALFADMKQKKDVLKAFNEGLHVKDRMISIRRADGSVMPALISLFPVKDSWEKVVYCDGILIDAYEHLGRDTGFERNPLPQQFAVNVLLQPVSEFMKEPPLCSPQTSAEVAVRLMEMRRSDLALVGGEEVGVLGVITHGDISRRLVAKGMSSGLPVSEIMSAPVISVYADEMMMEAFALMVQHKITYVVVKPRDKGVPGYISLLALSELRMNTPEFLLHGIEQAASVQEVAELMRGLPRIVKSYAETGTGVATLGKLISRVSDVVTHKVMKWALEDMGEAPAPFVFLALGSEGRREQTLATDQDNAIVYHAETEDEDAFCKTYFLKLGEKVCTMLHAVGYPFCDGGVMAMNEEWCMSLKAMSNRVSEWVQIPNPSELLKVAIFFDFRPVYGDFGLADRLQKHCLRELKEKSVFFFNMVQGIVSLKLPVVPAEVTAKGGAGMDVKAFSMLITGILRFWALRNGVSERNTLERLLVLQSADVLSETFMQEFDQHFRFLMHLRIKNQLRKIEMGDKPDNFMEASQLTEVDRLMLKKASAVISAHQNSLAVEYRIN